MQIALFVGLLCLCFGGIAALRVSSRRDTLEATRLVLARRAAWIAANRMGIGLALGGGLVALTGASMGIDAMLGETRSVELSRLEAGEATDASYVRVAGYAHGDASICRSTRGGVDCDTPVTSTAGGRDVALIVGTHAPVDGEHTFAGMVWSDERVPEAEIASRGYTIAARPLVVLSGETPEERRPVSLVILGAGLLVAVGGVLLLRRAERFPS